MPASTNTIAKAVVDHKDGPVPRFTIANCKPFVVTSISTKRYAPSKKSPEPKVSAIPPQTSTTQKRMSVPRGASTKQTFQCGPFPTVASRAEPRRSSSLPNPVMVRARNMTTKEKKSLPLPCGPSTNQSLHEKVFVPRPLRLVQKLKEGKLVSGCAVPAPVTRRATQVMEGKELPPRPSCIPRVRTYPYQPSAGVLGVSKKHDAPVTTSATGPRIPGVACRKVSVSVGIAGTARRIKTTGVSIKKLVVAGDDRPGAPTGNRSTTTSQPIVYLQAVKSASHVDWSPPASPDLSSFPSQSWTIAVDLTVKQTTRGNETVFDKGYVTGITRTPSNSSASGSSESVSSSATLLSPSMAMEALESPMQPTPPMIGSDGMTEISNQTKESCATKVSYATSGSTIISPSMNGTSSSMATLAKRIDSQPSPLTDVQEVSTRTRTSMVQCAIEIAQTFFSPLQDVSWQPNAASPKIMGANVSRIRKLFIPPLDEDAKASKNPMTQMEVEMLRARKKVAGGGVVNPRLNRLTSLSAMAIVTKLWTSHPNEASQV